MTADFRDDFDWQRGLIPCIKRVLANYLIEEAAFEEDAKRNTDLLVLKAEVTRVACRVRRGDYAAKYDGEFTVRSKRPSGAETELSKLLSGWGDYIFYGFADDAGLELTAWVLGDLREFRKWHSKQLYHSAPGCMPGIEKSNSDGTRFRVYRVDDLPPEFVRARKLYRRVAA